MTYEEILRDIIGVKPKTATNQELVSLMKELIRQNDDLKYRNKHLVNTLEFFKRQNVALMQENTRLFERGLE
jgi:hypothetical protein